MTDTHLSRAAVSAHHLVFWTGLLAGGALVVDTVTITVINRSFGALDDALFLFGFLGMWVTVVALAIELSRGRHGVARLVRGVAVFVLCGLVLGGLGAAVDRVGRRVFSDSNVGLHGEWSFFVIGLCLLGVAAWSARRRV